jgi:hypothetical protein
MKNVEELPESQSERVALILADSQEYVRRMRRSDVYGILSALSRIRPIRDDSERS